MKALHILALLGAISFGLVGWEQYSTGVGTLLGAIAMLGIGAAMPYAVALLWSLLVVPTDYAGASLKSMLRRLPAPETGNSATCESSEVLPIVLNAFREESRFAFNPVSGAWSVAPRENLEGESGLSESVIGLAGFGDLRFVGLWNRKVLFVALYTDGTKAMFRVGDETFDLSDQKIKVTRSGLIPFTKRFVLSVSDQPVLSFRYWWADLHEWPDDDVLDIFFYVPTHVVGNEGLQRFIRFWSSLRTGKTMAQTIAEFEKPSVA